MKTAAVIIAALLVAETARAQPAPEDTYVIQAGDTCLGIAVRILGDRGALEPFHKLNPQLGPLPHNLVAGTVVKLPSRAPEGPDAQLTRATGDVKFRKPSTTAWDPAARGMQLFRAWRVGAADRASAELMFKNDSYLGMRERTIVVIYGPEKKQAKLITATAELEEGALEARLGNLDGKPVVVRTPSARTDLRNGDVLVSAFVTGATIVANHRGGPIAVSGRAPKAKAVSVPQGMGSRVPAGGSPEPPRPLPPVPAWSTPVTAYAAVGTPTVQAQIAWTAVATAHTYRLVVRDGNGDLVSATPVVAPASSLDVALAPGTYAATIAAIDADGFESSPSSPLAIDVATGAVVPVGGTQPVTGVVGKVGVGSTFVAPAGWSCAGASKVVLAAAGPTTIQCTTAAGRPAAPVIVDATAFTLVSGASSTGELVVPTGEAASFTFEVASAGTFGDGLTIDASPSLHATITRITPTSFSVAIAPSATAVKGNLIVRSGAIELASRSISIVDGPVTVAPPVRAPRPWSAGVYGGYTMLDVGKPADLGNPLRADAALSGGTLLGVRGDWLGRRFGAELELGIARPGHASGVETATTFVAKVHGVVGLREGISRVSLLAGGGLQSVVRTNGGSSSDTDPVFDWGAMFGVAPRGVLFRLDLRHTLFAATGGGLGQGLELTAGMSVELPR